LAFLVISDSSLSAQSSANGPAGKTLRPASPSSAFFLTDESPQFVRPVFELKADLRI
jgi:hypothetical protein